MKITLEADGIKFQIEADSLRKEKEDLSKLHTVLCKSLQAFVHPRGFHTQEDEDTGRVDIANELLSVLQRIRIK